MNAGSNKTSVTYLAEYGDIDISVCKRCFLKFEKIWNRSGIVYFFCLLSRLLFISKTTAQKMKVSIKDIFSKSLMENIFCAVYLAGIIM